jgi:hypothetical protein
VGQTRDKGGEYVQAWEQAEALTTDLRRALPRGADDMTLLSFGAPGYVSPNLPALAEAWELDAAAKIVLESPTVEAYSILEGQQVVCGEQGVQLPANPQRPPGFGFDRPYDRLAFVSARERRVERVPSRAACQRALPRFVPGPYFLPEE